MAASPASPPGRGRGTQLSGLGERPHGRDAVHLHHHPDGLRAQLPHRPGGRGPGSGAARARARRGRRREGSAGERARPAGARTRSTGRRAGSTGRAARHPRPGDRSPLERPSGAQRHAGDGALAVARATGRGQPRSRGRGAAPAGGTAVRQRARRCFGPRAGARCGSWRRFWPAPCLVTAAPRGFSKATARASRKRCSRPCWSKVTPTTSRSVPPHSSTTGSWPRRGRSTPTRR